MKIEIKCETKDTLPLEDLTPFQGNLKTLDEKSYKQLRSKIINQGFSFPVFVWASDGNNYILDGHQRTLCLERLKGEGYEVPRVPIVYVQAETYKEAKEKLLSAASQFGDVDKQGLYEFIVENSMEPDFVLENYKLAGMNMDNFMQEYYGQPEPLDYGDKNKEIDEQEFSEFDHKCPKCSFGFDCEGIKK